MANVNDIMNEIDRIEGAKSELAEAIEEKGVEVPAGAKIDEYPELVRQIQQGGSSEVFCATYNSTTAAEIGNAYSAGKLVVCVYSNRVYTLSEKDATYYYFDSIYRLSDKWIRCKIADDSWGTGSDSAQNANNKVTSISASSTNSQYPSAKAVYDFVKALADANGLTMP